MKVRNKFSPRIAVIAMEGESKTQQHFRDQVNINTILKKYRKTGIIEHVKRAQERYGDFTELANYAQNLDKVAKAQQAFEMLPAELRNKFNNSIPGFFQFVKDDKNKDQLIKWGMINEPDAGTPASAKPAEPAPGSKKDGSMKKPPVMTESTSGDEA